MGYGSKGLSCAQFKQRLLKSNTPTKEAFTLQGPRPSQLYLKTKFLLLEAYSFARVSADKFPYMLIPMRVVLKVLKKNNLWLISATLSTDSFEEVREIATDYNNTASVTVNTTLYKRDKIAWRFVPSPLSG
jgi:hypothetical protein